MTKRGTTARWTKLLYFGFLTLLLGLGKSVAQVAVDPSSREQSRIFYQTVYPASENVALDRSGNVATGNEGITSAAFKDAMFLRVNFFRAMAGVSGGIVDNATFSAGAQKAALMMSSNQALNHTPPLSWINYSALGATAAGNSNLTLNFGLSALQNYMEDGGANNSAAGHRRWMLYPQSTQMGTGDIPSTNNYPAANALWIADASTFGLPRPAVRDEFVAWPPKGYVPYQLIYPRWSFSYPGADFTGATVNLLRNGANIPVTKEPVANGYGENSVVFIPDGIDPNNWPGPIRPASDVTTTVSINNVIIDGSTQNFTYQVIAFDPAQDGADSVLPVINGASNPLVGAGNVYSVNELTFATGYQWKTSLLSSYTVVDGAETDGSVTPQIPAGYAFRDPSVKAAGSYAYHLAQPNFQTGQFTLNASLVSGAGGMLNFKSRLGYATNKQVAKVQISTDGGDLWDTIWSQTGTNGAGEGSFQNRSVSLANYAEREIQARFLYDYSTGSAYPQTSAGMGWYVDDISFTDTQSLTNSATNDISPSRDFTLIPQAGGSHALQVRKQVYGKYLLGWSAITAVTASLDGNPPLVTRTVSLSGALLFGNKNVRTRTLFIKNIGNTALVVSAIQYPVGFTGKWSGAIAPGATKSVPVTFYPTARRLYQGNKTVISNATDGINKLAISGKGK